MNLKNKVSLTGSLCLLVLLLASGTVLAKKSKIDWNGQNIEWYTHDEGIELAEEEQKPAIVIIYADWCPTCKSYAEIFARDDIVEASSDFVMIRANQDDYPEVSAAYGFDGEYIPRTIVVSSEGEVMHDLYAQKKYKYYIGTKPKTLLSLMHRALDRVLSD